MISYFFFVKLTSLSPQMLVNEHPIIPPGCDQTTGCSVDDLKQILASQVGTCDFDSICGVSAEVGEFSSVHLAIALLITVTLIQSTYIFFHCVKKCPTRRRAAGQGSYSLSGGEPLLDDD